MDSEAVFQSLKSAVKEHCKLVAPYMSGKSHTDLDDLADSFTESIAAVESLEEPGKFVFKRLQAFFPGLRAEGFEPSDQCHHWKRLYTATALEKVAREFLAYCPQWLRRRLMVRTFLRPFLSGQQSGS